MRVIFFSFALILSGIDAILAQTVDRFPSYPFQISAIEWSVKVEPTLDGFSAVASYTLKSNRDGVQSISLAQRDLIIESVRQGDDELPFVTSGDSLRISLRDPVEKGAEFRVAVTYSAYPAYGFFIDPGALVWTSGVKGVIQGLIPIIDHPRVRFRTDVTVTHPSIIQVVTNGGYVSRTVLNVSEARTVFRSRAPIAASSMRLAFGMMQSSESRAGSIPVRIYVGDYTSVDDGGRALLEFAVSEIQRMSSQLKVPYPFDGLNVLIAPSSYGETWGDAAGFVILFDDLGDLSSQLKVGVASQWMRHALLGLEPGVVYAMASYARRLANLENPQIDPVVGLTIGYDLSVDVHGILAHIGSGSPVEAYPINDLEGFSRYIPGMVWMHDLEEIRFTNGWSKSPVPEAPALRRFTDQSVDNSDSRGGFILRFDRTENPEMISLVIDPYGSPAQGEYVMTLNEVYLDDTISQNVRFTESGGQVELAVDNGLLNVLPSFEADIDFRVEKPLGYWLHQFRSATDKSLKAQAARALGNFASDPDLGLLIRELERNETDPVVQSSLTLGMMESGVVTISPEAIADMLASSDVSVRMSVLELLSQLGEPLVEDSVLLGQFSKSDVSGPERRMIARLLSKQMEPGSFSSFIQAESKKPESRDLLSVLLSTYFDEGSIDAGIEMAEELIGRDYPFMVRRDAIMQLDRHDTSAQRWAARLPRLASDQDPRIRIMALDRTTLLDTEQARILLQDRAAKEADPRIRARIQTIQR